MTWRQQCGGSPALLAVLWLLTSHTTSAHCFLPGCTKCSSSTRTGSLCRPLAHGQSAYQGVSHCMEFLAKLFCGWGYDETNTTPGVFLMESPPWICGQRDACISHHTLLSGPLCSPLSQAAWCLHWPFRQLQGTESEKYFLRQPSLCTLQ